MEIIIFIVGVILGILFTKLFFGRPSGRLVIDEGEDQYFIALTDKTETLMKKKRITLKVYTKRGK